MTEKRIHDLIIQDDKIKMDILTIIKKKGNSYFIHEDKYINGITVDFTIICNDKICAMIECKGSNVQNVTEFVRGIGQILQYEYFFEEKISPKGFQYDSSFTTILLFPSSLLIKSNFNITKFKYPKNVLFIELNEENKVVREITRKELNKLSGAVDQGLITISQYYFRDNRIYELYLLLKSLSYSKFKGIKQINRNKHEKDFLSKLHTDNNRNWRNAFITISSLGFIDSSNLPTEKGLIFANMNYPEFLAEIFFSYINSYISYIFKVLKINNNVINLAIAKLIKTSTNNKDILFLTESDGRYIFLVDWIY